MCTARANIYCFCLHKVESANCLYYVVNIDLLQTDFSSHQIHKCLVRAACALYNPHFRQSLAGVAHNVLLLHFSHFCQAWPLQWSKASVTYYLTLDSLVTVMNAVNTKTHFSKEMTEFSFKNADVKSICYCKQRTKSKLSLSSECVETKLCKPYTSFTSHPHSWCGMVWYRTSRVNQPSVHRLCLEVAAPIGKVLNTPV